MVTDAAARLILDRCDELAALSSEPDFLKRVHLSPQHAAANELIAGWMTEAGLKTWQDAAGNQCGRMEGSEPDLPALLLGSHIDTVPDAGRYDGMLGVLLAISVAARIEPGTLPFALELVAFSDEEGTRFGTALLGSRAVAGTWDDEWWNLTDDDGITLFEAFQDFGLDPARLPGAFRRPEELIGYLEVHIEQGPILEDAGRELGVVTSIAAARRLELSMVGKAGHAGGTPFERRQDALVGASELVVEIERLSRERGVVGTVGKLEVYPGGVNVIPGSGRVQPRPSGRVRRRPGRSAEDHRRSRQGDRRPAQAGIPPARVLPCRRSRLRPRPAFGVRGRNQGHRRRRAHGHVESSRS